MEDQNPQAREQQPSRRQTQSSSPAFLNHEKIIQPSEDLKQEVAQNPEAYSRTPPPRSTPPVQSPPPANQQTSEYNPSQARNSAFSDALHAGSQPLNAPSSSKDSENSNPMTFSRGYNVGRSIFWFQFVVGIIFNLVYSGFATNVLKSASTRTIELSSLLYALIGYVIATYIPYYVIKNENAEEPFWVTVIGIAIESVYLIVYVLFATLLLRLFVKSLAFSISVVKIFQRGSIAIYVLILLGSFIITYFMTRVTWGLAFEIFGKVKSKIVVKVVGSLIIASIVGAITYNYLVIRHTKISHVQPKFVNNQQSSNPN